MSPEKERTRVEVNDFIRNSGIFDGVIDFEAAIRDPASPGGLRAEFVPGDHQIHAVCVNFFPGVFGAKNPILVRFRS